ncbi:galactose mutarotase-like protein [Mycena leptocephala]|nr:galactose mutarotase-like protein [Mycena leptocephala]
MTCFWVSLALLLLQVVVAASVNELSTLYRFANDFISFDVVKTTGYIHNLTYAGEGLLGAVSEMRGSFIVTFLRRYLALLATRPPKSWAARTGGDCADGQRHHVGMIVQRSWFLRTARAATQFPPSRIPQCNGPRRPLANRARCFANGGPWTHIVTNSEQWAPLPSAEASQRKSPSRMRLVLGLTPNDAYVTQIRLLDQVRCELTSSREANSSTGVTSQTTKPTRRTACTATPPTGMRSGVVGREPEDTFFGGPLHIDLMVDGIASAPFPVVFCSFLEIELFLYFNHGLGATLHDSLRIGKLRGPEWNSASTMRSRRCRLRTLIGAGSFSATSTFPQAHRSRQRCSAPMGAFPDNAFDPTAYQYWGPISPTAQHLDPARQGGTYRLTVFAAEYLLISRIFGDFVQDDVVVRAGEATHDASSGAWASRQVCREFRNGNERDEHIRIGLPYRIYWGAWDFPTQFPTGVNFTIGRSREGVDWVRNASCGSITTSIGPNTARRILITELSLVWIFFVSYFKSLVEPGFGSLADFNNWQINFDLPEPPLSSSVATFTIQLAAAKTTAGNTDANTGSNPSFSISTRLTWVIQPFESSSCGQRSAISCHLLSKQFEFQGSWLKRGTNKFVISLPFNAPVVAGILLQYVVREFAATQKQYPTNQSIYHLPAAQRRQTPRNQHLMELAPTPQRVNFMCGNVAV